MKTIAKIVPVFLLVLLIISCGHKRLEINKESKNDILVGELVDKYNLVKEWDTSYNYYSYRIQEKFIENENLMLFQGRLYDIIKCDSSYLLKILGDRHKYKKKFIAKIITTDIQFKEISNKIEENRKNYGAFVIKVSQVIFSDPEMTEEIIGDYENGFRSYYYIGFDKWTNLAIIQGKLIDLILFEN